MLGQIVVIFACCAVALPLLAADELWEWVTPLPQGHDLGAAVIGNGVRVAVGGQGTVITSSDAIEWRMSHTGQGYWLMDVVWGNGLFIAVGGRTMSEFGPPPFGVVFSSGDGFNWVERHRTDELSLEAVSWTGSRFVAVGIGNEVLLSSDGLSWSEQQIASDAWTMSDLAWNGSMLVAIGTDNILAFGRYSYFTSENGEAWQVQNFECEYCYLGSIAAVGGRFVIVGSWQKALVSDDGMTWNEAPYGTSDSLKCIVAGGDQFLATGYGVVGTSPDGYAWSIDELSTESPVYGLAWGGDGYLAVGEDGFMMTSPEGSEWTQLSTRSFDRGGYSDINELAKGGSTIVGVGAGIITGEHGAEWVQRSPPGDSGPTSVIWTGSAFWAAGANGVIRSIDGVHWAEMLVDHDIRLFDIAWNGSLFVAVGWNPSSDDPRKLVLTSADGHDWAYHWFDLEDHLFTVGWTGSEFVAAGSGTYFLTSTNGLVWRQHIQTEGVTLRDMAWNGDRLVAVGFREEVGGLIRSTVDGVVWLDSLLPEIPNSSFDDVTWTGTHFVAVSRSSGDLIFTSVDGLIWSSETTGTGVWPVSVVGDDRSLYVTGRGLSIIRRTEPLQGPASPRRPGRRVSPIADSARASVPILRKSLLR
jgi:hypothetical protein